MPPLLSHSAEISQFSERLWPSVWVWCVALGISTAGILVFAPISLLLGFVAAITLFFIQGFALVATTPRICLDARALHVGNASIERRFLGIAQTFRHEEARQQRGPQLHGSAFLCLRGWVDPVIRIEILDPRDPTPYWLISTRHPERLLSSLSLA